jgi:hypothetical protein
LGGSFRFPSNTLQKALFYLGNQDELNNHDSGICQLVYLIEDAFRQTTSYGFLHSRSCCHKGLNPLSYLKVNGLSARQNTSEKTQTRPTFRPMLFAAYKAAADYTGTTVENIIDRPDNSVGPRIRLLVPLVDTAAGSLE